MLLSLLAKVSYAQSFSGTSTGTASIGSVYTFSKLDNTSNNINFNTVSQIADGIPIQNFSTFSIKSNVPWVFSTSSATANFVGIGLYASTNMPASVLSLVVPGQTSRALSTTNQTLTTGTRGNTSTSGNTFSIDLTAAPGFSYGPGSYSIVINYTLTAQ
jgi:hypothetical protein